MNIFTRLLVVPFITPLLFVYFISILNLNKPIKVKILTWRSTEIPLGAWMAISGTAGFILAASLSSSINKADPLLRRKVITNPKNNRFEPPEHFENQNQQMYSRDEFEYNKEQFFPERDLKDPSPTVSAKYRVINNRKSKWNNTYYEEEVEDQIYNLNTDNDTNSEFDKPVSQVSAIDSDWNNDIDGNW